MLNVDSVDLLTYPPDTKTALISYLEPVKDEMELLIDKFKERIVKIKKDDENIVPTHF